MYVNTKALASAALLLLFASWLWAVSAYWQIRSAPRQWIETEATLLGTSNQAQAEPDSAHPDSAQNFFFEYFVSGERFVADNRSVPARQRLAATNSGVLPEKFSLYRHPEHPQRVSLQPKLLVEPTRQLGAALALSLYSLFGAFLAPALWRRTRHRPHTRPSGIHSDEWSEELQSTLWSELVAEALTEQTTKKSVRGSGVHS